VRNCNSSAMANLSDDDYRRVWQAKGECAYVGPTQSRSYSGFWFVSPQVKLAEVQTQDQKAGDGLRGTRIPIGRLMIMGLVSALLVGSSALSAGAAQATLLGNGATQVATSRSTSVASCPSLRRASLTGLTADGQLAWRTNLPRPRDFGTTPAIVSGGIVYADLSGAVTAVNGKDGHIEWSQALGKDVYGEWLIGSILVVDVDQVGPNAQVVGLDPASGVIEWRYRPGGEGLKGNPVPAGDAGLVIVASHRLSLLSVATGKLKWTKMIAAPSQPVADATTVAEAARGTMFGFAVSTGYVRWTVSSVDTTAAVTLDDGVIAIGSQVNPDPTHIAAYDLASGLRVWTLPLDAGYWLLTATTAGLVAVQQDPVDHGGIDFIEPATGRIAWRSSVGRPAFLATSTVVIGPDLAAIVDRPDNGPSFAVRIRQKTGVIQARLRLKSNQVPLTLTVLGSNEYGTGLGSGASESGFVEEFGAHGVTWRAELPQPAQTTALALPDGGIAVQTEDLVCIGS
jgi:outer membrane protein assembly factor BamB